MRVFQLIAQLDRDTLAAAAEGNHEDNPAARFVAVACRRELARRDEVELPEVPPLVLKPQEVGPTLAWLDVSVEQIADAGLATADRSLMLFGALLHHLRATIAAQAAPSH